jgi:ferrous iron transport protein B
LKILLIGNPNVGKSVIFSRLTGVEVLSLNYPGTSVEYTRGGMRCRGEVSTVIDTPGVYSLDPSSREEEVTRGILDEGADVIIDVVDATNLERNLNLTLQLLERNVPIVVALNLWDAAVRKGIQIDVRALEEELGVPVITTVAVSGQGIRELVEKIGEARSPEPTKFESSDQRWARIGEITERVQKVQHRHPSFLEQLDDVSLRPVTGIPIAMLVLYISFSLVVEVGEFLISNVSDPIFLRYSEFITSFIEGYNTGIIRDILVGEFHEPLKSFGLLTTGLYIPLGVVLPFLIPFYLILGFLEDLGYVPRLSVLMDALMHRLGLHGAAVMPCVLGLGCSVPAVVAVGALKSPKQRFIATTLLTMSLPCASQSAMVFGVLGQYGLKYIALVYTTLFAVFIATGLILNRVVGGESHEIFLEIPPYRMPNLGALLRKTARRTRDFLKEAVPYIALGMLAMNAFYLSGLMHSIGIWLRPLVSGLLGLPSDAATALIIGFLRKDIGIGMFVPLDMTPEQLVISSVVLAMYFPCVATLMVMLKVLGLVDTIKSLSLRLMAALIIGALLKLILI